MRMIVLHDNETGEPVELDADMMCILDETTPRGTPVHMSFATPEPTYVVRETRSQILRLMHH